MIPVELANLYLPSGIINVTNSSGRVVMRDVTAFGLTETTADASRQTYLSCNSIFGRHNVDAQQENRGQHDRKRLRLERGEQRRFGGRIGGRRDYANCEEAARHRRAGHRRHHRERISRWPDVDGHSGWRIHLDDGGSEYVHANPSTGEPYVNIRQQ
jgi:hypothetical protein